MALMHSCSVSCESHVAALTNQIVGLLQLPHLYKSTHAHQAIFLCLKVGVCE